MRWALAWLLLLSACAGTQRGDAYKTSLARKGITALSPEKFNHCRGYGCRIIDEILLNNAQWAQISALFKNVDDAASERTQIAAAIGQMERMAGAQNGTAADAAGTYVKIGDNQHDCVDESFNTTIYLSLLKDKGLLRFHEIGTPSARVPPLSLTLGPHQTAVIIDLDTQISYAVDSWFFDNGHEAQIVPMRTWFFGWHPPREGTEN